MFDDRPAIEANASIRHLWPLFAPLHPPSAYGVTVGGRPVLNLSLALNYAISELGVWSYHALNLLIHLAAGLALFGVVRRTLQPAPLRSNRSPGGASYAPTRVSGPGGDNPKGPPPQFDLDPNQATAIAFVSTLLWLLHPLQTEAVTYVVQRAESLMGLFYLLTLYGFIRGTADSAVAGPDGRSSECPGLDRARTAARRRSAGWYVLSFVACLLGMATKEVMVTAPAAVLLYDRTFLARTVRDAWRRRWRVHLALGSTWCVLGILIGAAPGRGGTVGFGGSFPWWQYLLTQVQAVPRYLGLSVWPHPLIFDYGDHPLRLSALGVAGGAGVAGLFAATILAWRRHRGSGYLGAWFFLILAPTSSVIPIATQVMAEHRMYLPLAAVTLALVAATYRAAGPRSLWLWLAVAIGFGWLTARRNLDYRTTVSLWADTVAKNPENPRARGTLGYALDQRGQVAEAIAQYRVALRLQPRFDEARIDLGNALVRAGRAAEAVVTFREAVRSNPDDAVAHYDLATLLARTGRFAEAVVEFQAALRLGPPSVEAHNNLGNVFLQLGQPEAAAGQYRQALRLDPDSADAHNNLGGALFHLGRIDEARRQFEQALRLRPDDANARANLIRAQRAAVRPDR